MNVRKKSIVRHSIVGRPRFGNKAWTPVIRWSPSEQTVFERHSPLAPSFAFDRTALSSDPGEGQGAEEEHAPLPQGGDSGGGRQEGGWGALVVGGVRSTPPSVMVAVLSICSTPEWKGAITLTEPLAVFLFPVSPQRDSPERAGSLTFRDSVGFRPE